MEYKNKIWAIVLFLLCFINFLEARLFFLHVPKTGGTTMRFLLEAQLSSEEIYPFHNTRAPQVAPIKENLVSGHFPYWFCKELDDHFEEAFKVTILREPVERYLSFLRAKKKADTTLPDLESVLKRSSNYSLGLIDNAFCRFLTDDPSLEGEALLEKAKQSLEKFDCVIFFDQFSSDVITLFQRFGISIDPEEIPKINTTEIEPVSAQLLEEVRRLNELDIRLYEYAQKSLLKKNTTYSLRTSSFDQLTKEASEVDYTFDLPLFGRGWTYRDTWNTTGLDYPIFRWVMNYPAKIYFSLEEGKDYIFSFNAWSLTEECLPRVRINGREIELTRMNVEQFSLYKGLIPKDHISSPFTEFTFFSNKAVHYKDVFPKRYNRNHPLLSFAVNRIQFEASRKYP